MADRISVRPKPSLGAPLRPSLVRFPLRGALALGAVLLAAPLLGVGFWTRSQEAGTPPPAPVLAARLWTEAPDATASFTFDAPGWAGLQRTYAILTRAAVFEGTEPEREERLKVGTMDKGPFAFIVRRSPPSGPDSFVVAGVRHAAEAGLAIVRFGRPDSRATSLGPVETAPVIAESVGAAIASRRDCLAVRAPMSGFHLLALFCPERNEPLDLEGVVCSIRFADGAGPKGCPAPFPPNRPMRVSASDKRGLLARARQ